MYASFASLFSLPLKVTFLQVSTETGFEAYSQILFLVAMVGAFYFFMIRPRQKRQKEHRNFIASLKEGESVVTVGGIHGKILSVSETALVLEIDKGVKIKVDKTYISHNPDNPAKKPVA
ncbi:preprotein translocase subunit YajC [Hugenholtzia roseola]|uniref:preprotein translocase subunit YajC n=1 Tax=Hugenholtzia roseola TaxID=1002 RepID=UPI000419E51B|nr:preprotein translocase subunit YajC [Hugenholtzia roseola]